MPEPLTPTSTTRLSSGMRRGSCRARLAREDGHLGRRADLGIVRADRQVAARRSRSAAATRSAQPRNSARVHSNRWSRCRRVPAGEAARSATLYSAFGVVTMTVPGAACAEHGPLQRGQPWRVDVLDHLHQHGGVEPGQPVVAVGQRRLEQLAAAPAARPASGPAAAAGRGLAAPGPTRRRPTTWSNRGSASRSPSSAPSPQPRSPTRRAPRLGARPGPPRGAARPAAPGRPASRSRRGSSALSSQLGVGVVDLGQPGQRGTGSAAPGARGSDG